MTCNFVDTPFCNLYLTSSGGQKSNFTPGDNILIPAIRSLMLYHQSDHDSVTIKTTSHEP